MSSLRARCRDMPTSAGIYRMLDDRGQVIYVGKARHLRKRVSSYFNRQTGATAKVRAMIASIHSIEVTITANENEALILESNLIKELRPRYNVVLRDDKSYPYIYAELEHEFPRLRFHRGARSGKGRYFGPFPNAGAVRSTLKLLQKLFMIRQCEDSFFSNRSRPCLQYQIDRCTAPCVGLIGAEEYAADVRHAILFLEGRAQEVIDYLVRQMEEASSALEFERAARFRDQITSLQKVQSEQHVAGISGDFDVVAAAVKAGVGCVQVFFIRHGRMLGNKAFFPAHTQGASSGDVLEAFLAQFYLAAHRDRDIPRDIIVGETLGEAQWLAEALSQAHGRRIRIRDSVRGERSKWVRMATDNAVVALDHRLSAEADHHERIAALGDVLDRDVAIERIECFDVSHLAGESTVASCVVFDRSGPRKSDYRKFNIKQAGAGDDYAAMHEALDRRYSRLKREEGAMPDLIVIDGGKGQVAQALAVLDELQIDDVLVVGIAKGVTRKPGFEKLVLHDGLREYRLAPDSPALHLLQHVRDEAHRFAIEAHRRSRANTRKRSPLEQIIGIGAKRRQKLMQHFGGLQGITRAGIDDLRRVPGISQELAQRIYDVLHV
ncbi:MAG: excinuclease ABC subunit UvrC [Gammaproteobacteria bacterium]|nr:excinuclease ABC subunit UvrC [Gammaproteobacteria bacterium]